MVESASIPVERNGALVDIEIGEPRYTAGETVTRRVREAIDDGVLESGDELPGAGEIGKALRVSRIAANEGLKVLETENRLSGGQGSHWHVV